MEALAMKLNKIVDEFIKENISVETREEFKIAAIHFNVNLNTCSKYDLMRIDHKAKELAAAKENKLLTISAIFSYILFREINRNKFEDGEKLRIKTALLSISTAITDYLTYRIDENELNKILFDEFSSLEIQENTKE